MKAKKKPKRANRTSMIMVRLKPAERSKIEAKAKTKGLNVSSWVRMIVLSFLDEKAKKS